MISSIEKRMKNSVKIVKFFEPVLYNKDNNYGGRKLIKVNLSNEILRRISAIDENRFFF